MITKITLITVGMLFSIFSKKIENYNSCPKITIESCNEDVNDNAIKYRVPTKQEWEFALKNCLPIVTDSKVVYGVENGKLLNYRLPTKTEWEYAIKNNPPIVNDANYYRKESENSFNYRLPTKTEWEHAILNY